MRGCLVLLGLVLAGCAVTLPDVKDSAPVTRPAGLLELPDPEVKNEPPSATGNHSPYVVNGRTYNVWNTGVGYDRTGLASWYGTKFHGRKTSSGEPYDMYALTAAHRHLSLPSYVRVTNLDNDISTVVRVNDRGPFHDERIIDVSYAAAVKLGFAEHGTARVRVTSLFAGPNIPKRIFVQAGAYTELTWADRVAAELKTIVAAPIYVVRTSSDSLFRVRIGPMQDRAEAERLQAQIAATSGSRPDIGTMIVEE
ncbi:MAG: septal ring lytic transglycosylase RlpA family protein [Gammaproteobacteria bacterium]|nr:septal ring lytic transglycosylase RlpA family protein [Gammaproteobacteria bacterium]